MNYGKSTETFRKELLSPLKVERSKKPEGIRRQAELDSSSSHRLIFDPEEGSNTLLQTAWRTSTRLHGIIIQKAVFLNLIQLLVIGSFTLFCLRIFLNGEFVGQEMKLLG